MTTLVLEVRDEPVADSGVVIPGAISITPAINEDYWLFRVRLSEKQAVVGFPKFGTIGIGFAQEEDWNTNLPYTCAPEEILAHIEHNKGDESISDSVVLTAIIMISDAARRFREQRQ